MIFKTQRERDRRKECDGYCKWLHNDEGCSMAKNLMIGDKSELVKDYDQDGDVKRKQ